MEAALHYQLKIHTLDLAAELTVITAISPASEKAVGVAHQDPPVQAHQQVVCGSRSVAKVAAGIVSLQRRRVLRHTKRISEEKGSVHSVSGRVSWSCAILGL